MKIIHIVIAICSILFFMIGLDKFSPFMDPPCSLATIVLPSIWKLLGVLQLAGGILIWIPILRKYVAGFFVAFMLFFIVFHLMQNTYDIGGAAFIASLLGIVMWNPSFLGGNKNRIA